ncbi:hypothetical protein SDJN02_00721, partial [Cucurbita argyrosperma subsp. argyrosperma]
MAAQESRLRMGIRKNVLTASSISPHLAYKSIRAVSIETSSPPHLRSSSAAHAVRTLENVKLMGTRNPPRIEQEEVGNRGSATVALIDLSAWRPPRINQACKSQIAIFILNRAKPTSNSTCSSPL